jgi:hypothetical protein
VFEQARALVALLPGLFFAAAAAVLAPATSGCKACGSSGVTTNGDGSPGSTTDNDNERQLRNGTKQNLRSVWGSSESDVWAVGDAGTILHFDGRAWSMIRPVTLENLTGVRGSSPKDVWACGDKGTVFHWDGATWTRIAQAENMTLLSVWTSGPNDVWAGGMDGEGDSGYVYRFNGEKWTGQPVPGSTSVWDVFGTGPGDVWMVGSSPSGTGVVLHGDGKKFDAVGYKGSGARGVWSPHPGDTWVAPYTGAIEHYDGKTWTHADAVAGAGSLLRISGSAPDDVWAVGLNGTILHNRGGGWVSVPSGATDVIWSVWSRAVEDAWAVGNGGTILRWNGSSWHKG